MAKSDRLLGRARQVDNLSWARAIKHGTYSWAFNPETYEYNFEGAT